LYFKRVKRFLRALFVCSSIATMSGQTRTEHLPPLDRALPPRAETIYQAIVPRVDTRVAMETVTFMSQFWRLAGNPGYDRSIDFIAERLAAGRVPAHVDSFENSGQGWEQERGTLSIEPASGTDGGRSGLPQTPREIVLSREQDQLLFASTRFPRLRVACRFRSSTWARAQIPRTTKAGR